jgi:hypothetical protein
LYRYSKAQLTYMTATQGTALWACALSTAKDAAVELDGGTSQRMLFLAAVALEIAQLSRAQVCLAGVFASLARDEVGLYKLVNAVHAVECSC